MQNANLLLIKNDKVPRLGNIEESDYALPQSWYPVFRSKDIKKGQIKLINVFGGQWVIYRNYDNQLAVHSRYCCHMGVDMLCAKVVGNNIMCPLHRWEFNTKGTCEKIPAGDPIPKSAKQQTLPCDERYGIVFVFWGNDAIFQLPAFPGLEDPIVDKVRLIDLDAPYESITLNGFDAHHFQYIHNREIEGEPIITANNHYHLAIDFLTKVNLRRWPDYITRLLGFRNIKMRLDCWGGNLIMVSNDSTQFRALLALTPLNEYSCRVYFVGAMDRQGDNLGARSIRRVYLRANSILGKNFLDPDKPVITGMRPRPGVLLKESDRPTIRFWQYWKGLPRKIIKPETRQAP